MLKANRPGHLGLIYLSGDLNIARSLVNDICDKGRDHFEHLALVSFETQSLDDAVQAILFESGISYSFHYYGHQEDIRGLVFKEMMFEARSKGLDFLAQFNEGASECLSSALKTLDKTVHLHNSITCFYRDPNRLNLGRCFNSIANIMASVSSREHVPDVKGDGINIFKVSSFVDDYADSLFNLSDDSFYFWDLVQSASFNREKVQFIGPASLRSPGSPVKLNTKFFLKALSSFSRYLLLRSREVLKNKSSINPREVYRISSHISSKSEKASYVPELTEQIEEPAKELVRLDHFEKEHSDIVVVNWCLTNICNYKCTYCPDELHNGTKRGPELEDIQNFFQKIKQAHPGKKVFFEFTGGEVTYYKQFPELIRYIKANGGFVGILSNAGRKLDFWEKHHEFIDHICLSFHSEQGKPDHFFDVAAFLCQRVSTHINIMMKPENFDTCYELAQRLATDCEVSIAMQPLLEGMDGAIFDYTAKQRKILDEQILRFGDAPKYKQKQNYQEFIFRGAMKGVYADGSTKVFSTPELISKNLNQWAGWNCHIGLENLVVNLSGEVFRGWCGVGGPVGKASDPNLRLPEKPILCNKKFCNCGQDIMATKVKKPKKHDLKLA